MKFQCPTRAREIAAICAVKIVIESEALNATKVLVGGGLWVVGGGIGGPRSSETGTGIQLQ